MKNFIPILISLLFFFVNNAKSQFSFTSIGTTYNQDFETFEGTAASLPVNWSNSFDDYTPGGFYSNAGSYNNQLSTYALDDDGGGEYAIGSKIMAVGGFMSLELSCINNTGQTITSFSVNWDVEQYSSAGRETKVFLFNSLGGTISDPNLYEASTSSPAANLASVSVNNRSITYSNVMISPGSTFSFIWNIETGNGSGHNAHIGIDNIIISVESVLPVELATFNADRENNCIKLNWSTYTEINNDYFFIEKSPNGIGFEKIGQVSGTGTSFQSQHYSFIDTSPLAGNNYYRLKQVDFDGKKAISKVITVKYLQDSNEPLIYPTIFNSGFWVNFHEEKENGIIYLFDFNGRLLFEKNIGLENSIYINMGGFINGTYFLVMDIENHKFTKRVFKF